MGSNRRSAIYISNCSGRSPSHLSQPHLLLPPPVTHLPISFLCSAHNSWPLLFPPTCSLWVLSSTLGCQPALLGKQTSRVHASKMNPSLLHHDFALRLLEATRKPGNLHLTRLPQPPHLAHPQLLPRVSRVLRLSAHSFQPRTQVFSCFLQSPSFSKFLDQKHRTHLSFS